MLGFGLGLGLLVGIGGFIGVGGGVSIGFGYLVGVIVVGVLAIGTALGRGLLGSQARATLGKGLLACGLLFGRSVVIVGIRIVGIVDRGEIVIVVVPVVIVVVLGRTHRIAHGVLHRVDDLGLHDGLHLLLRLAELTDRTADGASHGGQLVGAEQQKAEDHDDRQLAFSNTEHKYLQGSICEPSPHRAIRPELVDKTALLYSPNAQSARAGYKDENCAGSTLVLPHLRGVPPYSAARTSISWSTPKSCTTRITPGWAFTTAKPLPWSTAWCAAPTSTPMPVESM